MLFTILLFLFFEFVYCIVLYLIFFFARGFVHAQTFVFCKGNNQYFLLTYEFDGLLLLFKRGLVYSDKEIVSLRLSQVHVVNASPDSEADFW